MTAKPPLPEPAFDVGDLVTMIVAGDDWRHGYVIVSRYLYEWSDKSGVCHFEPSWRYRVMITVDGRVMGEVWDGPEHQFVRTAELKGTPHDPARSTAVDADRPRSPQECLDDAYDAGLILCPPTES